MRALLAFAGASGGLVWLLAAMLLSACGSSSSGEGMLPNVALPNSSAPYVRATGSNVLPVHIGAGTICGKTGYLNEPCTTVTVCVPGTNECQTLTDILVDTGSVGLRVFSSALTVHLPFQPAPSAESHGLAECAQFGIGSDWGPIAQADVVLAEEPPVNVNVQVIDRSFATAPSECTSADSNPAQAGFNGILGVGPFNEDCGASCAESADTHAFYSCDPSGTCKAVALPLAQQPQNIVSRLPKDNNGVLIALDQVPLGGVSNVEGSLILGVATGSNNQPQGAVAYGMDVRGNFTTLYQGQAFAGSFLDTGSNGVYFPNLTSIPICPLGGAAPGFYCPKSVSAITASNLSSNSGEEARITFGVGNAENIARTDSTAIIELAGPSTGSFDWGAPFFFGRAVFLGYEGKSSPLGSGLYVAY